jgi:hypothetical protein
MFNSQIIFPVETSLWICGEGGSSQKKAQSF